MSDKLKIVKSCNGVVVELLDAQRPSALDVVNALQTSPVTVGDLVIYNPYGETYRRLGDPTPAFNPCEFGSLEKDDIVNWHVGSDIYCGTVVDVVSTKTRSRVTVRTFSVVGNEVKFKFEKTFKWSTARAARRPLVKNGVWTNDYTPGSYVSDKFVSHLCHGYRHYKDPGF